MNNTKTFTFTVLHLDERHRHHALQTLWGREMTLWKLVYGEVKRTISIRVSSMDNAFMDTVHVYRLLSGLLQTR